MPDTLQSLASVSREAARMTVENRVIQQAYRYALDPTPRQVRQFTSHVGGARVAYNQGLAWIAEALDAYAAEKAEGVSKPTTKIPGHFDLCKMWTAWKDTAQWTDRDTGEVTEGVPWVSNNFVGTYQAALRDAHMAWKRFFDSKKGALAGPRVGRPRFKKKGKSRSSFQVHGTVLRVVDAKHVKLPKIGVVKVHESTKKLGRRLRKGIVPCPQCKGTTVVPAEEGKTGETKKCKSCSGKGSLPAARIVRGTVSQDSSGRWFISFTVEVVREIRTSPSLRQRKGGVVGVDFGVRDIATLSSGEVIENPRYLESNLRKLKRAQQSLSRCSSGSARSVKARKRVGRIHARVRYLRSDYIHKTTSDLVHRYAVIGIEGWDVQRTAQYGSKDIPKKIRADRNRALAEAGIGEARWQIGSKSFWYGAKSVTVDKHHPTGRQCSACGTVKTKPVPQTQDEYRCFVCGFVCDRRMNTAKSIANIAAKIVQERNDARSGRESLNAHGGEVSPAEPSSSGRSS